jgi:predicted site-specific integrase-resolvase
MSFDRKGFQHLCEEVIRGNVELIVIENKDRLMRFGFDIFEGFFKYFGTKIVVLSDHIQNKTYEHELSDDLIAIIHYFSMKSYNHRRKLNKIRKELEDDLKK